MLANIRVDINGTRTSHLFLDLETGTLSLWGPGTNSDIGSHDDLKNSTGESIERDFKALAQKE
jgi:hypothetical protein